MKIHNGLPILLKCLEKWDKIPSEHEFITQYSEPMIPIAGDFFEDFYPVLQELDWKAYRSNTLKMDSAKEETRLKKNISLVEDLFGFNLEGEIMLLGTFETMDGYARFDRGTHRVFMGIDESFADGKYIDVLTTHELTHVARESRPEVWEGFGLNPKMAQHEFTNLQPVIEHLMGEGFSCAISEILVRDQEPWTYVYQDRESLAHIMNHASAVDRTIHKELNHADGDYGRLYNSKSYSPPMPTFTHYVWAWKWVKHILKNHCNSDPRQLVALCSKNLMLDALKFELK